MARSAESTPLAATVSSVLESPSGSLAGLRLRLQRSQACLQAVLPTLPPGLRPHLLAGPWDDQGWTLLTRQAAALTKLRHLKPHMERALQQAGLSVPELRIHVLMDSGR